MPKKIVIIGAGIAGLSAGVYARLNGFDADIYEKHTLPGGLCNSWKRKGFTFDGCIHWLTGSGPKDSFYGLWTELGAIQGRTFIDHDIFHSFHGSDGRILHFYTDVEKLEPHLLELSPDDSELILQFCGWIRKFSNFTMPMNKAFEMYGIGDILKMMIRTRPYMKDLNNLNNIKFRDYAGRFRDPLIKEAITGIFGTEEFALSALVLTLSLLHNRAGGVPVGGSLEFARSIEKRYLDLGGEIHFGKEVNKILVDKEPVKRGKNHKDMASGIMLDDGTEIPADYVISAADLRTTVYNMLDGKYIEPQHEELFRSVPLAPSSVMVFYGLNKKFPTIPQSASSSYPADPCIKVGSACHDRISLRDFNYDPGLAPEGKSVVSVLLADNDFDYWENLRNDHKAYKAEKDRIATDIAAACEKIYPGFQKAIEVTDVVTPITYHRYTGNYRGKYMTWMLSGKQSSKFRMVRKTLPGLDNFYLSGMWVMPPGGVPTGAKTSRDIIQLICKKEGVKFSTPQKPADS